jgi:hypothetical protein
LSALLPLPPVKEEGAKDETFSGVVFSFSDVSFGQNGCGKYP